MTNTWTALLQENHTLNSSTGDENAATLSLTCEQCCCNQVQYLRSLCEWTHWQTCNPDKPQTEWKLHREYVGWDHVSIRNTF